MHPLNHPAYGGLQGVQMGRCGANVAPRRQRAVKLTGDLAFADDEGLKPQGHPYQMSSCLIAGVQIRAREGRSMAHPTPPLQHLATQQLARPLGIVGLHQPLHSIAGLQDHQPLSAAGGRQRAGELPSSVGVQYERVAP